MAKTSSGKSTTTKRSRVPVAIAATADAMRDKKADDVLVLDLRKADAFTDFFIMATGQNRRQVQAISDAVETALRVKKQRPAHVEGYERGEWILLDYFDFVVHVFTPTARAFYGLDRLWGNATPLALPESAPDPDE
ncbi:MAG: ribosome silencing factor [Acidobacteriota bacterium]